MRDDLTIREIVIDELLKTGKSDVHVEDISEVVEGCVAKQLTIKIAPYKKYYVQVSI